MRNPHENTTNSFITSCPHLPNTDVSFMSGRLENNDEILDGGRTNRQKKRQSFRIRSFLKAGERSTLVEGGGGAPTEQGDDDRARGR